MAVKEKVGVHMNLYKDDVEIFEEIFGKEHGTFSRITREFFHNFVLKSEFDKKKRKGVEDE